MSGVTVRTKMTPEAAGKLLMKSLEQETLLLWVLSHHQGGKSKVGQKIRQHLNIGQFEPLNESQLQRVNRLEGGGS